MTEILVTRAAVYKDGGTEVFRDDDGKQYYVDNRIRTGTRGFIFDRYPADAGAQVVKNVRLVHKSHESFNHVRRNQGPY